MAGNSVVATSQSTVLVSKPVPITTAGEQSQGILAQSIGGGGGAGGTQRVGRPEHREIHRARPGDRRLRWLGRLRLPRVAVTNTAGHDHAGGPLRGHAGAEPRRRWRGRRCSVSTRRPPCRTRRHSRCRYRRIGGVAGTANAVAVSNAGAITTSGVAVRCHPGAEHRRWRRPWWQHTCKPQPAAHSSERCARSYGLFVGGSGGNGATGSAVTLSNSGASADQRARVPTASSGRVSAAAAARGLQHLHQLNASPASRIVGHRSVSRLAVGGCARQGGNAGSVTLTANTGAITTGSGNPTLATGQHGHGYGIFLQSIGGGGGDGAACASSSGGFALGGTARCRSVSVAVPGRPATAAR